MRCELCKKKIEETFLGKLKGTVVKIKQDKKNILKYVCGECQKRFGDKLKKELKKGQ